MISQSTYKKLLFDLGGSKKPVLLIGGGCPRDKLKAFVEKLQIPFFVTWNALDLTDLPTYCGVVGTYGGPGRNFGIQNCDLLLTIGTRISGRITGGTPENFAPRAVKWIVDIDPGIKFQPVQGHFIIEDAGAFMEGLGRVQLDFSKWLGICKGWMQYDPVQPRHFEKFSHYGFVRRLSEILPPDAIVVSDTGGNVIMMGHCFRSKWGQRLFSSNGNTAMGFAFCGALGAWFAAKKQVICLIGDGGFNMNLQEIQTMLNYKADVKTFILNNHCYGNTKLYQKHNYQGRYLACGPDGYSPPDFIKIADAYGVTNARISSWKGFEVLPDILALKEPVIIDVVDDSFDYEPRISRFDQDLDDQDPPLPREELERNRCAY